MVDLSETQWILVWLSVLSIVAGLAVLPLPPLSEAGQWVVSWCLVCAGIVALWLEAGYP